MSSSTFSVSSNFREDPNEETLALITFLVGMCHALIDVTWDVLCHLNFKLIYIVLDI